MERQEQLATKQAEKVELELRQRDIWQKKTTHSENEDRKRDLKYKIHLSFFSLAINLIVVNLIYFSLQVGKKGEV